ncbi:MAG TPA: extracellular solute-binding protein [Mesorhizobium sp.]|jgi:spermidine/putrescine-binding protein|nr:extracellular solute-binding protein [Mesorhizobium sp.]
MTTRTLSRRLFACAALAGLLASSAAPALAADDLTVFDWSGYEDPNFHPAYAAEHGASPTFAFFADEDEALAKLMAGFKADIAHPCSQTVVKWRDAGLIEPLDTAKIAGWNDLMPGITGMKDLVTTADGKAWMLPFDWGNTALVYRTDKVPAEDVQSLHVFADPKYQGRVSIGDNVDDAYALASLAIGLKDWTKMTDEQFKEASDFLRQVHKNVVLYWTDGTEIAQAMAGGDVDIAWAWNEAAVALERDGVPVELKKDTKEGLSTWVCGYVHLKDNPGSDDKVYDYLSAVNQPEVSAYLVNEWGYGHANDKGMKAIPADQLQAKGYHDVDQFVANTLFQAPVPNELKQRMIAEFEKIKAGY